MRLEYGKSGSAREEIGAREGLPRDQKFVLNVVLGGISGCVAKTLLAPMEVVRVLVQTGSPLSKKEYCELYTYIDNLDTNYILESIRVETRILCH